MAIATINPATGEIVKTFTSLTDAQVRRKNHLGRQNLCVLPPDFSR